MNEYQGRHFHNEQRRLAFQKCIFAPSYFYVVNVA